MLFSCLSRPGNHKRPSSFYEWRNETVNDLKFEGRRITRIVFPHLLRIITVFGVLLLVSYYCVINSHNLINQPNKANPIIK